MSMTDLLDQYAPFAGPEMIRKLRQLASNIQGVRVVHVNSTREGGGVAEILNKMVPLMQALQIDTRWEVIKGSPEFYQCTKGMHNALQGNRINISREQIAAYESANEAFARDYGSVLEEAEVVFIHDPQPAPAVNLCRGRKGKWVWRCHIDISQPHRPVWNYLRQYVANYDASIFSMQRFAQNLPHIQYLLPPSIDPLSDKNRDLPPSEVAAVREKYGIDPEIPMILQVSRYDRFKDPVGVILAYQLVKRSIPVQLVLAGGEATDDPEGQVVLDEVRQAAGNDPDIRILNLPPDAHLEINALQRAADIIVQKSVKEGFGLTVSEAMWKEKPVIGGDVGGIRLQIQDHHTGFLVTSPEGAALRIRYLLHRREMITEMGRRAREFVCQNFLLTRHLRDYLALIISLISGRQDEQYLEVDFFNGP
jgi:trehalose synthase